MKDKTFGESSASPRAAGFFAQPDISAEHPPPYAGFHPIPRAGTPCLWCLCSCLSFPLLFLGSDVMLGSYTVLPSPFLFPSLSACTNIPSGRKLCLHLPLLPHKRNPLCPPCGFFWLNKCELSLAQQRFGSCSRPPSSLPAPADPGHPCGSNGTLLAGLEKFASGIQAGFVGFSPPPPFLSQP